MTVTKLGEDWEDKVPGECSAWSYNVKARKLMQGYCNGLIAWYEKQPKSV